MTEITPSPLGPSVPSMPPSQAAKKPRQASIPPPATGRKEQKGIEKMPNVAVSAVQASRIAPIVPYTSAAELQKVLKPGDIFLTYEPENIDWKGAVIRFGQELRRMVQGDDAGWKAEGSNFVHGSLYVGEGKLSEAVGNGVRINRLDGERFKLEPDMTHGFLVVRLNNELVAKQACLIGDALSIENPSEEALFPYSYCKAVGAGFSEGKLDDAGLVSYLKGAVTAYCGIEPLDENGVSEFFCSHFVGWACQAAESTEVIERVNRKLPPDKQIEFPDLSTIKVDTSKITEKDPAKRQEEILKLKRQAISTQIDKWTNDTAKTHGARLREEIKLDYNPAWMTPQVFYNFIADHPEIFTVKMLIVPPPK